MASRRPARPPAAILCFTGSEAHSNTVCALGRARGDVQSHCTESDGRNRPDKIAEAAEAIGYEFLTLTDHSPSVRVAGESNCDEVVREQ